MRIVGVVPGAKLFGSEDLYADHYLFVNGYPKRIAACGGHADRHPQQRRLCHSGGAHALRFVRLLRRRALLSLSFSSHGIRGQIWKAVLGICLGMQMMNTYFLVAEEAVRRGWPGPCSPSSTR